MADDLADWGEMTKREVTRAFRILAEVMPGNVPGAKGPKEAIDPFRGCVSCMLSAQSRDENTARATKALFRLARKPHTMLKLDDAVIANAIKPAGLYNNKTRSIKKFCRALIEDFNGVVPRTREELMSLPGIGRKCADIVLQFVFDQNTIAVDTHVHRICNRSGIARGATPDQTAIALEARAPDWALAEGHFWLIQFAKRVCVSRNPRCEACPLQKLCRHYRVHGQPKSGRLH
ncbi:MAG: endonuclease III [Pseudomonadota bacterium]